MKLLKIRLPKISFSNILSSFGKQNSKVKSNNQSSEDLSELKNNKPTIITSLREQTLQDLTARVEDRIRTVKLEVADFSQAEISLIETEINQLCSETANDIVGKANIHREWIERKKQGLQIQLDSLTEEERIEDCKPQGEALFKNEYNDHLEGVHKVAEWKDKLKRLKSALRLAEAYHENSLKNKFNFNPPEWQWYNNIRSYKFFLGSLFLVEAILNFTAIQALSDASLYNWIIPFLTAVLSLVLAACAHFTGMYFSSRNREAAVSALGIGLLLLAVIVIMRAVTASIEETSMETGISPSTSAFVLILLIIAFFGFGVFLAKIREDTQPFFNNKDRIQELGRQKAKLESSILKKEEQYFGFEQRMDKKIQDNAKRIARLKIGELENSISRCQNELELLKKETNRLVEQVNKIYERSITSFRSYILKARRQENLDEIEFADNFLNRLIFDKNEDGNSNTRYFNGTIWLLPISIWLFGLSSCTDPVKHEIVLITDLTISDSTYKVETEKMIDFVLKQLKFNTKSVIDNEIRLTITTIGDVSVQPEKYIVLHKAPFWRRVEGLRKAEMRKFLDEFRMKISEIPGPTAYGLERSYVHDCLCQQLVPLARSDADIKIVIAFSDVLENTPSVSFYNYKNNVNGLIEDYEVLSEKFEKNCKIGDLTGIEFILIHLPNQNDDALFDAARKYWSRYLEERSARFTFFPNV